MHIPKLKKFFKKFYASFTQYSLKKKNLWSQRTFQSHLTVVFPTRNKFVLKTIIRQGKIGSLLGFQGNLITKGGLPEISISKILHFTTEVFALGINTTVKFGKSEGYDILTTIPFFGKVSFRRIH